MALVSWAPEAESDMATVYEWIAHHDDRKRTAKAILRELRSKCDDYAKAFAAGSVIGTARPDIGDACRIFSHKRWVVVFRPATNGIDVVRVLDGSRDYPRNVD